MERFIDPGAWVLTLASLTSATGLLAVFCSAIIYIDTHRPQAISRGKRVSYWWTMGVNQDHEATRTAQAIINLALMTGNIGRPGTGANSITGQCNAMGSRVFSNTTKPRGTASPRAPSYRSRHAVAA